MPLTFGLGQFYSKEMQPEKNVLWHLQAGSCNFERPTILRLSVSASEELRNFKSMYTELNSSLEPTMNRYNILDVRSFGMEDSCDGHLLYNHTGSLLRATRGRDNVGADCLSRNPLEEEDDEATLCKIRI